MKNKKIIFVAAILLVLIVFGFSVDILGFSFSTRYYNTIIEAYNNENTEYVLENELVSARIDNIAVALCKTTNEEIIITPFKVKDSRYYSLSHIDVLDEDQVESIEDDIGESFYRVDGKKVYYNLIETENVENYKKQYLNISFSDQINANDGKTLVLVLYYK